MPEIAWFKLWGHSWFAQHGVVALLGLGWRNVSDGFEKAAVVEPVDPFERGELHRFEVAPWSPAMDYLDLVKAVDRFGESVVVTVANASDRRLYACLRQSLRIANRHILRAAVGMMNQPATFYEPPIVQCLVESIEHKARMGRPACSPTDDAASEGIDDERDVNEALPGRQVCEIRSQSMFGAGVLKWRLTRSSGQGANLSDTVVLTGLPCKMP